jgi:multicomponent Na+:H+ antiporter subunit C
MIIYALAFLLFLVGLYGLLTKKNLVKIVISVIIMEYAAILFIVSIGDKFNAEDPLLLKGAAPHAMVDPLAHAMALAYVLIGFSVLALMVSLVIRLYENYGTLDITKIKKLKG